MLNHILVPLDGSEVSERALPYAKRVVDPTEGTITLLTVLDVPDYPVTAYYPTVVAYDTSPEKVSEKLMPQAKDYLNKTAEALHREGFRVTMSTVIGEPAGAIVEKAEELKVDAIVMSTHGRSGISRWLFGSVASKVLESSRCPVFIIPVRSKA